jgi:hypothetical protein
VVGRNVVVVCGDFCTLVVSIPELNIFWSDGCCGSSFLLSSCVELGLG